MSGSTVRVAERRLEERFDRTKEATQKLAGFVTSNGRQIALQRERKTALYLWVEVRPPPIVGVTIERYPPSKSRGSHHKANVPSLAEGNEAWKVVLQDLGALATLMDWYEQV